MVTSKQVYGPVNSYFDTVILYHIILLQYENEILILKRESLKLRQSQKHCASCEHIAIIEVLVSAPSL